MFRVLRARKSRPFCKKSKLLPLFLVSFLAPFLALAQNQFIFQTGAMPDGRGFHGSAVLGDFLYVFGGTSGTGANAEAPTESVLRTRIAPDGSVSGWKPTTPLPQPRHYIGNSTLVLNDVVYIIGGSSLPSSGERYNTAVFTRPLPNGTLLPWTESQPFSQRGLSTITAVSTPGHVHIIGGLEEDSTVSQEVYTNAIYSDGSMGQWEKGPRLPLPLWYHSAGVASGRVYVWGGMPVEDSTQVSPYIISAPILGSGKLGAWRREPQDLPQPYYSASTSVAGPYLLSFSPRYTNAVKSSHVWFAQAQPNGLSRWVNREGNLPNRVYHASATDYRRGSIYLSGGRSDIGQDLLRDVYFFRLSPQARAMAEQGWLAHQRAHQNTVSAFPPPSAGSNTVLSYVADRSLSENAVPGFKTYSNARSEAESSRKPLVLYFNLEDAAPCVQQVAALKSGNIAGMTSQASFAWIDTQNYPQLAQQLGVYRVPTWVFFDRQGDERESARTVGVMTPQEIQSVVGGL